MIKFVQIVDDKVIAEFSCLQDPEHQPGVIEVNDDDLRYIAFITPVVVEPITNPVEKLKAFLIANPDVAELLK